MHQSAGVTGTDAGSDDPGGPAVSATMQARKQVFLAPLFVRSSPRDRCGPFSLEAALSQMFEYARPSVDDLIKLPDILKSCRQFLAWTAEAGRKVPLKADGSPWGSYCDTDGLGPFESAIDFL